MSTTMLLWKFRGSAGPFTQLPTVTLPCEVRLVRDKLKETFGLSNSTAIDFLLYLESNPDVVLSDYHVLPLNSKIYTKRCASAEALSLISRANEEYLKSSGLSTSASVDNDLRDALQSKQERSGSDDNDQEDEDSKISSIINEQNFFDSSSTSESLSRRYYRNRMLLCTNGKLEEAGGNDNLVIDKIKFPATADYEEQVEQITVDADYICHMCGERGHHIRNCVQPDGKRLSKKIRSATGIPTDFLTPIPDTDITKYEEVYILKGLLWSSLPCLTPVVLLLRENSTLGSNEGLRIMNDPFTFSIIDGTFAIMREIESVSGGAFFTKTVDQRIQMQLGITHEEAQTMSRRFKCSICTCYFNNPVTTLCCGESFCLDCIVCKKGGNNELGKSISCPKCKKIIRVTDLQANASLKKAVQSLILGNVDILKNGTATNTNNGNNKRSISEVTNVKNEVKAENKKETHKIPTMDTTVLKKQKNLAATYISQYLTKK